MIIGTILTILKKNYKRIVREHYVQGICFLKGFHNKIPNKIPNKTPNKIPKTG